MSKRKTRSDLQCNIKLYKKINSLLITSGGKVIKDMPSIHINNNMRTYVVYAVMKTTSIARASCVDFYCSHCHLLLPYMYEPPKKNIRLFIFTYLYLVVVLRVIFPFQGGGGGQVFFDNFTMWFK